VMIQVAQLQSPRPRPWTGTAFRTYSDKKGDALLASYTEIIVEYSDRAIGIDGHVRVLMH
jgi:hypothetical protein